MSHILTRSQYVAPLTKNTRSKLLGYGEGRKFDPTHEVTDKYILCRDCDSMLGRFEDERGKLFQKLNESDFSYNNGIKLITGVSGTKIKLACLADLFRCSITSIETYQAIFLGNKHESNIIRLFNDPLSCAASDYPTVFFKFKTPFPFEAIQIPVRARVNGRISYRAIMPYGWCWVTKVDSTSSNIFEKLTVDKLHGKAMIVDSGDERFAQSILQESYKIIDEVESKMS